MLSSRRGAFSIEKARRNYTFAFMQDEAAIPEIKLRGRLENPPRREARR